MKKILILMLSVVLIGSLSSCKKDEDKGGLVGTKWTLITDVDGEVIGSTTIHFTSASELTAKNNDGNETVTGTYTYNDPTLTITADGAEVVFTKVNDKKFTGQEGDVKYTLTKM